MLGVGHSGNGVSVSVAEGVSDTLIGESFSGAFPDIAEFVAQTYVVAVTIPVDVGARLRFFKMKKTTSYFAVSPLTFVDHTKSMYRFHA